MEHLFDVLVVGGGVGGIAAALAAARMGKRVLLSEESDWLGGQLTSQAVPPDEHRWIEGRGCTAGYRVFRESVRSYYRSYYPLTRAARKKKHLNPGEGAVSRLCHEPRVALAVLEGMLAPWRSSGLLSVMMETYPVQVERSGDRLEAVHLKENRTGLSHIVQAPYIIDATETGELLQLGSVEHVTGSESQSETEEPHALPGPSAPLDQQAIGWCFPLAWSPDTDNIIAKPSNYDTWRARRSNFWPGSQLSWTDVYPHTLEERTRSLFLNEGKNPRRDACTLWEFRRIISRSLFAPGFFSSDITLVNWPQIDYWYGPVIGVRENERNKHMSAAKDLSLSFLYWMQTEAPRHDGGCGYPELTLRPDVVGTADGLAKRPYIRESRRMIAEVTIREQDVCVTSREKHGCARQFPDTVGTGCYRIDLHPSTGGRTYIDLAVYPFQISLGALIPISVENLLPGCKNIGTTHITNGCYRLHPVEWNIGEVAGALAAFCLDNQVYPREVYHQEPRLKTFQHLLETRFGVELIWPPGIRSTPV
ncbi:MAG: FAD-dependent oxidoreductase [Spirochaetales bacterium]|nr:FAD-dependent oxidoreductase [Spirochaetales bacterium]